MKHALEVAKAGSLSKASEVLLIAAPNISRSIKELMTEFTYSLIMSADNPLAQKSEITLDDLADYIAISEYAGEKDFDVSQPKAIELK